jgi:hypothetical protein
MNDIPTILEGLDSVPKILVAFVGTMPEDALNKRRGEGFWTIAEHVVHLGEVQPMLFERLVRFGNESRPVFAPYIPAEDEKPARETKPADVNFALERFCEWRKKQANLLKSFDAATWKKSADHPEYVRYSAYILARHILMHDHWHMYRMEELWLTKDEYLSFLPG